MPNTPATNIDQLPLGSTDGPIIYFDGAPNFGFNNGVGNVTLEALRYVSPVQNEVVTDRVVVAHLRMNLNAAMHLRAALDGILLMAAPEPGA